MAYGDGGAAFPTGFQPDTCEADYGMSLRDYFAGQALAASIAMSVEALKRGLTDVQESDAARQAYRYADAMLAERAKEQS